MERQFTRPNGGQTWTSFASCPTFPGYANGGTIAASTPQNIILAPGDGVQPYYTLNGGADLESYHSSGCDQLERFRRRLLFDERSVTADRVLANTFYLYYPGQGVFESTNGGARGRKSIAEMMDLAVSGTDITPFDWYNNELMSVPGEAGNLFFTGGRQGSAQPDTQEPFHAFDERRGNLDRRSQCA